MAVYEPKTEDLSKFDNDAFDTDKVKSIPLWAGNEPSAARADIQRVDILDFGDEGFLLKNTLSKSESRHLVDNGELLQFENIPEAKESYRNCKRILLRSDELSELIWKRIEPFLGDITIEGDPHAQHIHGVQTLLQGTWKPHKLNNLWRFCRYFPGGHFAPHFDGHYVQSPELRSMKTFMLYLNGGFEGGTTNFVAEDQELYMNADGKYCAEEKNVLHRVVPESGLAIVFNHHRLHEGQALKSGTKYILRTDILYKRTEGQSLDPNETEALSLAQAAERLEAAGDCMEAMRLYKKAFRMSPALAASYGCP